MPAPRCGQFSFGLCFIHADPVHDHFRRECGDGCIAARACPDLRDPGKPCGFHIYTIGNRGKDIIQKKGIPVINIDYIFGFRSMMTNKLIETPEDMKGLKIRTPGSELYVNTINCMGATATPMGFADTISAVQQGVVDGLEGTIDAYNSNGSAEVAKQMALTKHLLGVCGAYINEDLWNSIPEEYRTIMQEEFDAGAERMVKKITESEAEIMKKLEAEKGISFNEVDSEAFKALVLPIYEEMVAKKGVTPGLYERFQEIIAEMP